MSIVARAEFIRRTPRRKILLALLAGQKVPVTFIGGVKTLPAATISRIEFLRHVPRQRILFAYLRQQAPTPAGLYRQPQRIDLRFPPAVYPRRRKAAYTLELAIKPTTAVVPNVLGLPLATAVSVIGAASLVPVQGTPQYSPTVPLGDVISQSPSPGSPVAAFSQVTIVISLGVQPVAVIVPNVIGQSEATALALLGALGFGVTVVTVVNAALPLGTVALQTPTGGASVFLPFTVVITVVIALSVTTWPRPSTITNLPVRGCWALPGGQQAVWVVGSGAFLMTVATPATGSVQATFALKRIGTLQSSVGPVCIRDNGAGGTVCIVDGPNGYFYTFTATGGTVGNFSKIIDPAFLGADRIAFIDGWWIFNQPGTQTFYVPQSTYSTIFEGSNFALIDSATDNLVTLHENKEELWLVGERHTEIWYDAGGQYFPFARLESTMLQVGCSAKHSIARFMSEGEDGLAWLALSERGQNVVIKTVGFSYVVISSPAINNAIASYPKIDDAIGYTYQEDGHEFYVLTFPSVVNFSGGLGITWTYDGMTDMWHQRLAYEPYSQTWYRHRSNCFLNFQNQRLVGDFQNGLIYRMDRAVYTDNGWPLRAWRRAPHIWDGAARERVFMAFLQLEFRPGVGNQAGLGYDPQAVLSISRDGGTTWGQLLARSIGRVGRYLTRTIWRRLSFARDAVIDVTVTDPVNRDIVGATLKKGENG